MGCFVEIYDSNTKERHERHYNSVLADAKAYAVGWYNSFPSPRGLVLTVWPEGGKRAYRWSVMERKSIYGRMGSRKIDSPKS